MNLFPIAVFLLLASLGRLLLDLHGLFKVCQPGQELEEHSLDFLELGVGLEPEADRLVSLRACHRSPSPARCRSWVCTAVPRGRGRGSSLPERWPASENPRSPLCTFIYDNTELMSPQTG